MGKREWSISKEINLNIKIENPKTKIFIIETSEDGIDIEWLLGYLPQNICDSNFNIERVQ